MMSNSITYIAFYTALMVFGVTNVYVARRGPGGVTRIERAAAAVIGFAMIVSGVYLAAVYVRLDSGIWWVLAIPAALLINNVAGARSRAQARRDDTYRPVHGATEVTAQDMPYAGPNSHMANPFTL
jgi:hypothetical protein